MVANGLLRAKEDAATPAAIHPPFASSTLSNPDTDTLVT